MRLKIDVLMPIQAARAQTRTSYRRPATRLRPLDLHKDSLAQSSTWTSTYSQKAKLYAAIKHRQGIANRRSGLNQAPVIVAADLSDSLQSTSAVEDVAGARIVAPRGRPCALIFPPARQNRIVREDHTVS